MEAITAQGFGRFECEMLTLGELEAFGEPLKKVLSVSAGDSGLDAAGPHTSVVISYLRHLERAYPRLWTKKNGTPGALDGTMPVSPAGSPPSTPRGVSSPIARFDSVVSDESGSSSAAAELGEQWLSTYEETKIAFNQLVAGDASDLASLHESLQWLVGVAPQIKALIAEENNMTK